MRTTAEIESRESEFHDERVDQIDPYKVPVRQSFESVSSPENRFILRWLGSVRGLKLLDIGCGAGESCVYFAMQGAEVTAIDISSRTTQLAKEVARLHGVKISVHVMSSNSLDFNDNSFDVVYGANVLHHVDTQKTLKEVHRVLRPGGRACFWDPLAHNPIINVYRRMASGVRTKDEHPLRIRDLAVFSQFTSVEHETFWLTALWVFVRFYLIERIHPSKEPYWKKIITEADRLRSTLSSLFRVDSFLLRTFPFLKRYCWNIVVCVKK